MAGNSVLRALQGVDQFRQVSRDLTRGTLTGGIFTAVTHALLLVLLMSELGAFLRMTYQTNVYMDDNTDEEFQLNFNITMLDLPCKFLKVGIWDKYGEREINTTGEFVYVKIEHEGAFKSSPYSKEEIMALESLDDRDDRTETEKKELDSDWSSTSDHFKHKDFTAAVTFHDYTFVNFFADWCSHCRHFSPTWMEIARNTSEKKQFKDSDGREVTVKFMKINCVDFQTACADAKIAAFPTLRLYKRDGTFEPFRSKRTPENLDEFLVASIRNSHLIVAKHRHIFTQSCQVTGTLFVPRVPGHFYLVAEPLGDLSVNPAFTNVSHTVNHLSFGRRDALYLAKRSGIPKEMLTHLAPLDGQTFAAQRFHEAPQHYLKVVSTHLEGSSSVYYQMTHTDRVRKLSRDGGSRSRAPQARFNYDLSPMSVVVRSKRKRWYEFLTSIFAILGGVYTVMELTSGAVDTVGHAVKEAMGKTN